MEWFEFISSWSMEELIEEQDNDADNAIDFNDSSFNPYENSVEDSILLANVYGWWIAED